ncbi:MAG: type VI secretion system-associated protein TagF [Alphaproteobacteria bacterium]|nr:type VI secretion system-associated protein TagF [Alphaproteobacteria bacterium]
MSGEPLDAAGPGFFGKVPAIGDFVRRGLPGSFVEPWDAWMRALLQSGTSRLGDDWLEIYLTSPIWRFVLPPGTCGPEAVAGVMVPSIDAVGRCYPLTLAELVPAASAGAPGIVRSLPWFEALEQAALGALAETFDLEQFAAGVAAIGPVVAGAPPAATESAQSDRPGGVVAELTASPAGQDGDVSALSAGLSHHLAAPLGLWWTIAGSQRLQATSLLLSMSPAEPAGPALFAGRGLVAAKLPAPPEESPTATGPDGAQP